MPTKEKTVPAKAAKRSPVSQVSRWFKQWLTVSDEADLLEDRGAELKKRLLDTLVEHGEQDEKGSSFLEFTDPIEFTSHDGTTKIFTALKRERFVTPANPLPDPAKAEVLLRQLHLWPKPADEKVIKEFGIRNPYVKVTVTPDVDALAQAYFKGLISEEDYDACLVEQREGFRFRPVGR